MILQKSYFKNITAFDFLEMVIQIYLKINKKSEVSYNK